MYKHKKSLAIVICVVVVLTLFFSLFYIVAESNHGCSGRNCSICQEIQICTEALTMLGIVSVISVFVCIITLHSAVLGKYILEYNTLSTLVSQKVKLTD